MKNKRILLLILAAVLVAATVLGVSAYRFVGDVNGDGKISVFDAQLLSEQSAGVRDLTDKQTAAAGGSTLQSLLDKVLGITADVEDTDGDGVFEIYTPEGLYAIADHPGYAYVLANDLSLDGALWVPVSGFSGSLDGQGHTISNLVISTSAGGNMGFFGDTTESSSIRDLHLQDITLTADESTQNIGALAGISRGNITGCTVEGAITGTQNTTVGVFAGRMESGTIVPAATLSIKDDTGNYTVSNLCANMKIKPSAQVGLAGWTAEGLSAAGQWVDTTYDSIQLSQTMQDRQNTVIGYMNEMGTIPWQVSEYLEYNATNSTHDQKFYPAILSTRTYYGLPYCYNAGSLERFLSKIDSSSGKNVTVKGLEDGQYHEDTKTFTGFVQYMGNDCSTSVGWSWARVSPTRVARTSETEYAGGAYVRRTPYMVPNLANQARYGVYPVGEWTTVSTTNDTVTGEFAYQVTDEANTLDIYTNNGQDTILNAYAMTRRADALVFYHKEEGGSAYGHSRLVVADPVVIRSADGSVDPAKSFFVTTEQGDGLYDNTNSSWRVNYKYTFAQLLDTDHTADDKSSGGVYLPITIRALRSEYVKPAYTTQYANNPVVSPVSGKFYCNYRVIRSTVTVTDASGQVLFDNTAYTGVTDDQEIARNEHTSVDLQEAHGEAFAAAAGNFTDGTTYYFTLKILISDGSTRTVTVSGTPIENKAFIYEGYEG